MITPRALNCFANKTWCRTKKRTLELKRINLIISAKSRSNVNLLCMTQFTPFVFFSRTNWTICGHWNCWLCNIQSHSQLTAWSIFILITGPALFWVTRFACNDFFFLIPGSELFYFMVNNNGHLRQSPYKWNKIESKDIQLTKHWLSITSVNYMEQFCTSFEVLTGIPANSADAAKSPDRFAFLRWNHCILPCEMSLAICSLFLMFIHLTTAGKRRDFNDETRYCT